MRVQDPGGELVEAREFPGLLVERTLEDEGPFYKLYPEGMIEHFDDDTDHEGWKVTALPLPRARRQLTGISGSTSRRYEWDGMRAQNRF